MRKKKGIRAERELVHMFNKMGWVACRIAGSGSSNYLSPDLIVAKEGRILAIESRTVNNTRIYINEEKRNHLKEFARRGGFEGWFAIRFDREGWFFVPTEDVKSKHTLEELKISGKKFEEV